MSYFNPMGYKYLQYCQKNLENAWFEKKAHPQNNALRSLESVYSHLIISPHLQELKNADREAKIIYDSFNSKLFWVTRVVCKILWCISIETTWSKVQKEFDKINNFIATTLRSKRDGLSFESADYNLGCRLFERAANQINNQDYADRHSLSLLFASAGCSNVKALVMWSEYVHFPVDSDEKANILLEATHRYQESDKDSVANAEEFLAKCRTMLLTLASEYQSRAESRSYPGVKLTDKNIPEEARILLLKSKACMPQCN